MDDQGLVSPVVLASFMLTVSLAKNGSVVTATSRPGLADSAVEVARFVDTHGLSSGFGCEDDAACAACGCAEP